MQKALVPYVDQIAAFWFILWCIVAVIVLGNLYRVFRARKKNEAGH